MFYFKYFCCAVQPLYQTATLPYARAALQSVPSLGAGGADSQPQPLPRL